MFLGSAESVVSKNLKHDTVVAFLKQANQAYVECAQYLQKKLPLNSSLLQSISAIDPIARGHSVTADRLKRLPKLVTNVLMQEEEMQYSLDVHLYQVDKFLPSYTDEHGNVLQIDLWWAAVFRSNKYCALSKMVRAILSCFHGPQWFKQARDKNIPISGPIMRAKAEQFASALGSQDFKASTGWLNSFKDGNDISFKAVYGESGVVNIQAADEWKKHLKEII
ncbi:hypothetical protein AVEN_45095-1 [Araneus ventricosus]|uniref:HTH CENPB-type domain-containing protein n=1 Tax=Araneus ventricosus TaxID=182803 RepID=A0A4Y2RQW7_ARAVE|nr:hypothetical protein AVEN_45095-1 [Araneus ventricosus]